MQHRDTDKDECHYMAFFIFAIITRDAENRNYLKDKFIVGGIACNKYAK